jgi:hypothetical protein
VDKPVVLSNNEWRKIIYALEAIVSFQGYYEKDDWKGKEVFPKLAEKIKSQLEKQIYENSEEK